MSLNSIEELRNKSDEELIEVHDKRTSQYQESPTMIREELARRESSRINRSIKRLTWFITILTVLNTGFVIFSALN